MRWTVRDVRGRGERSCGGVRGPGRGWKQSRRGQNETVPCGERRRLRDHEGVLVQRSARFMAVSVHDQPDAHGVMDDRFRMMVPFAGEMRHNNDARRPREKDRGKSHHRRTRSTQEFHSRNIVDR